MKNIIIISILILFVSGCKKPQVGYLETINAEYIPDSTVWQAVLNPEIPDEARQIELGYPFSTADIQGVQGTEPIFYSIRKIDCSNGNAEATSQFYMSGSRVQLPYNHTVPQGRYIISVTIENEGHSHYADSALTVIIQ